MLKYSIHIRKAQYEDASMLSDLIKKSFQDVAQRFNLTVENCPKHPSNCTDEWVKKDIKRGVTYYYLLFNDLAVGCVALEKATEDLVYLERLAVLSQYRRKGLGKVLVGHVINESKKKGAQRIGIGIISKQTELKSWYCKLGFTETERKEFKHLPFIVSLMTHEL